MASKWQFGNVDVYVREFSISVDTKRAEVIPLDSAQSVYHFFGSSGSHFNVTGLVIGTGNAYQLLSDAQNNISRNFVGPWGTASGARINGKPEMDTIMYAGADLDGVSYDVETTPLFNVTMEIIA